MGVCCGPAPGASVEWFIEYAKEVGFDFEHEHYPRCVKCDTLNWPKDLACVSCGEKRENTNVE